MDLREEIEDVFDTFITDYEVKAIELLIKREQKKCLEAFAEDVKENGRPFIINDKINDVIMIRKSSIDEIKQKHIDKL